MTGDVKFCNADFGNEIFVAEGCVVNEIAFLSGCCREETPVIKILGGEYKAFRLLVLVDFLMNQLLANSLHLCCHSSYFEEVTAFRIP